MNLIWIHFSMFIIPNVIRVFLTFFGSVLEDFPRRVISHPYCYVHYDVLDTTCVIGCLMNDILILFLCLLSRMLFGVFLISFSLVFADFPAEYSCNRFVFVHYPECYSGFIIFLCLLSTISTKQQGFALPNHQLNSSPKLG